MNAHDTILCVSDAEKDLIQEKLSESATRPANQGQCLIIYDWACVSHRGHPSYDNYELVLHLTNNFTIKFQACIIIILAATVNKPEVKERSINHKLLLSCYMS